MLSLVVLSIGKSAAENAELMKRKTAVPAQSTQHSNRSVLYSVQWSGSAIDRTRATHGTAADLLSLPTTLPLSLYSPPPFSRIYSPPLLRPRPPLPLVSFSLPPRSPLSTSPTPTKLLPPPRTRWRDSRSPRRRRVKCPGRAPKCENCRHINEITHTITFNSGSRHSETQS